MVTPGNRHIMDLESPAERELMNRSVFESNAAHTELFARPFNRYPCAIDRSANVRDQDPLCLFPDTNGPTRIPTLAYLHKGAARIPALESAQLEGHAPEQLVSLREPRENILLGIVPTIGPDVAEICFDVCGACGLSVDAEAAAAPGTESAAVNQCGGGGLRLVAARHRQRRNRHSAMAEK